MIRSEATEDTVIRMSRIVIALLTAVAALSLGAVRAEAATPANDNFASAQNLTGTLPISVSGTTVDATREAGEPDHSGFGLDGPNSVWYRFTPTISGEHLFDCSSGQIQAIAVYSGSSLNALTKVSIFAQRCQAGVSVTLTANVTYRIAVSSINSHSPAAFQLVVSGPPTTPANDDFENARQLTGFSAVASGTTRGAAHESGEPDHSGAGGSKSVWYSWTAPQDGTLILDACDGTPDPVIAAYTGSSVSALTPVSSSTCRNAFRVASGTTYRIAVDATTENAGPFEMKLNLYPAPSNDDFTDAEMLNGESPSAIGDTRGSTHESGEPNHHGAGGDSSIWYSWTAPDQGVALVDTCAGTAPIAVAAYTGSDVTALSQVQSGGCDIAFQVTTGTTYAIAVDSTVSGSGSFTLDLVLDNAPPSAFNLSTPADGAITGVRPQFGWQASSDAASGLDHYEVYVDGNKLADVPAGTHVFTPSSSLGAGGHSWYVSAVDAVGYSRDSASRTFTVDNSPPSAFSLIAPGDAAALNTARPTFSWQASSDSGSGLDHYEVFIDSAKVAEIPAGTETFTPPSPFASGDHSWRVSAVDAAGNSRNSGLRVFSVESTPPTAFGLIAPADNAVTDARPQFSWQASSDAGTGLDHYEVSVDGNKLASVTASTTSLTPNSDLAAGTHSWDVTAFDEAGNTRESGIRTFTVASPPQVTLGASPSPALTDQQVQFSAFAQPPAGGTITGYAWDLDGDGSFERDTGGSGSTSTTYAEVGSITASVRVTTSLGTSAVTSTSLEIRPRPPAGELGVSINNGDTFTNDRNVEITAVWPTLASDMLVSNDGGFAQAAQRGVTETVPWTLQSSGPERLPKTVYVRFRGAPSGDATYQDDIILDETAPVVESASSGSGGGGGNSRVVAKSAKTKTKLKIVATDQTSGVDSMQITSKTSSPGKLIPYKKSYSYKGKAKKLFVRVTDRAGNVSAWKKFKK